MLHHGKHAPVPTILRTVEGIKFEMSSFCAYNFKISQFKHLLCYILHNCGIHYIHLYYIEKKEVFLLLEVSKHGQVKLDK